MEQLRVVVWTFNLSSRTATLDKNRPFEREESEREPIFPRSLFLAVPLLLFLFVQCFRRLQLLPFCPFQFTANDHRSALERGGVDRTIEQTHLAKWLYQANGSSLAGAVSAVIVLGIGLPWLAGHFLAICAAAGTLTDCLGDVRVLFVTNLNRRRPRRLRRLVPVSLFDRTCSWSHQRLSLELQSPPIRFAQLRSSGRLLTETAV